MLVARVVGRVVATRKHPGLSSRKLLLIEPEPPVPAGTENGRDTIVAVDGIGAGPGDCVLVVFEGRAASTAVGAEPYTIDAAVIGIIDPLSS